MDDNQALDDTDAEELIGDDEAPVNIYAAPTPPSDYHHPGGAFKPGNPWAFGPGRPPPGRPKGVREKITRNFLDALADDFAQHGAAAIAQMRRKKPADYVKVIASLLPKQLEVKDEPFDGVSDGELAAIVAAARGSLGVAEGRRGGDEAAAGHEPAPRLPALPEAEAVP